VALEAQSSLRRIKSCFLDLVAELPGPWSEWRMRRRQDLERKWQQEMSEEAFKFAPLQTIEEERRQAKEGIFTPQESRYAPSKNSRIKPAEPLGKLPVDERRRMVVVGSGPAGYTAALYSGRALLRPLMFAGDLPGGQLMLTSDVENFPGYTEAVGGPTLMEDLRKQAEKFGAEVREQTVTAVDLSVRPFRVRVPSKEKEHGHIIETDALVISTGASAKWLGVEGEEQVKGRGVSTCATCDAALCFDEDVLVVGGGDVAFEDALFLARFAKSITLIHRSDVFKAQAIMQKRAQREPKVKIVTFCQVNRWISDDKGLTGAEVLNLKTGETQIMPCAAAFVAIGHESQSRLFRGQLMLDEDEYIVHAQPGFSTQCSVPGVFACGDVVDRRYRQAITAAGSGCAAALDAERWLDRIPESWPGWEE